MTPVGDAHDKKQPQSTIGEPLLAISGISKQFSGARALDALTLNAGETPALVGENGAGQSTLIKILANVYSLDSGRIIYRGGEVSGSAHRSRGASILIISTDFEEVTKICHYAVVFDHGRVVAEIPQADLSIEKLLAAANANVHSSLSSGVIHAIDQI